MLKQLFHRVNPTATPQDDLVNVPTTNLSNVMVEHVGADKAFLSRSLAGTVQADGNVTMTLSGALSVRAGDDAIISGGIIPVLSAGGDLHLESGNSGVLVSRSARVESGVIGMLVSTNAQIDERVKVLIGPREALLLAGALGILLPLVRYLLQRIFPPPPPPDPEAWRKRPFWQRALRWVLGPLLRIGIPVLLLFFAYRRVKSSLLDVLPSAIRERFAV
jgi:hypothetical protein